MEQMRIAIVPYEDELAGELKPDLDLVGNAIQRQVSEHLEPAWGASAIVSAFPTLDDVPEGYATVAITKQELPLGHGGFHYPDGGAGALVHYRDGWTIAVSHELLEMIADPLGVRYVYGPSLADRNPDAAENPARDKTGAQGLVRYLVELCDPVEGNAYIIDGIAVSDFVFPAFYDDGSKCDRYSFTYAAQGPFQLADGGYISWTVERDPGGVFQAFRKGDKLTWRKVTLASTSFSRQSMDVSRSAGAEGQALPAVGGGYTSRGDLLRATIGRELASRDPGPDPYVNLIDSLAHDKKFYNACNANPRLLLDKLRTIAHQQGADLPLDLFDKVTNIAPQSAYQALSAMYQSGHPVNYDFRQSRDAMLLSYMFRH